MQKKITIAYKMVSDDKVAYIPIVYEIQEDAALSMKVIKCRVDLPAAVVPSWLFPVDFEITTHNRYGFHVTNYNDKEVRTQDAEFFRYKAYADILLYERLHSDKFDC